jgi:threonyl-tRNA synthetase
LLASGSLGIDPPKETDMIDHRQLGRELDLFHSNPLVGAGLPIWLPAGAAARYAVESFVRREEARAGYRHVYSPPMARREMYERSGHLAHFADDMFPPMRLGSDELVLRPSLCPHHAMVFASRGRSYRELPLRIGEMGVMYREERSGVLSGLSRVRAISLNDGHIFCAEDQIGAEVAGALDLIRRSHAALGIEAAGYRLSRRGPGGKYAGAADVWERSERVLRAALVESAVSFVEAEGEAAFYGPKIDVQMLDHAGREFTLATVQVDFHQPEQFDLSYVDSDGERRRPVMVHRSAVGSFERLFAHLIEVHEGAFPAWFAPVQLLVLPVGADEFAPAADFAGQAERAGLRVEVSVDGSLASRVREAALRKIPYQAVIGAREAAAGAASLRLRGESEQPSLSWEAALALLRDRCAAPDGQLS